MRPIAGSLVVFVVTWVLGWGSTPVPAVRWDFQDVSGWEPYGLWRVVDERDLRGMAERIRPFPSPTRAFYFGVVDPDTGTGSYHTGSREQAKLYSPQILVGGGNPIQVGDRVQVKFHYYREVEKFDGPYDKTVAHLILLDGQGRIWDPAVGSWRTLGEGVQVFYKDARDPSSTAWQEFVSQEIVVPDGTTSLQVSFFFDSVDHLHNSYLGWLIDNVEIHRRAAPLTITTDKLRDGRTDWFYWDRLEAQGGTPPYSWSLGRGSVLPPGLALNRESGDIEGKPTEAGEFRIEFVVTDNKSQSASKSLTLVVRQKEGDVAWRRWWPFFSDLAGWTAEGLWHWEKLSDLEPGGAYFAVVGEGHYDTGRRVFGSLRSPDVDISTEQGRDLEIFFLHRRQVEAYPDGGYDRTLVQVRFYSGTSWGDWTTIWSKDCQDAGDFTVGLIESVFTRVPPNAQKMQIQFYFDSVDALNNRYPGWLLYVVEAATYKGRLKITTSELPPGELRVPYSFVLKADGGSSPYGWSATGLPEGLGIERDTGRIHGTPRQAGTFTVRITVEDGSANTATRQFSLTISPEQVTLFMEDFENFVDGLNWLLLPPRPSLWRVADKVWYGGQNVVQGRAAYYGTDDSHYDIGVRTKGALTSKPIPLAGASHVKISFDYWREVESYSGEYDQTYVEVRFGSGPWHKIWGKDSRDPSEKKWTTYTSSGITVPSGATTVQIRFVFDSVDQYNNLYVGWIVDNVRITKATSGSPLSAWAQEGVPGQGTVQIGVLSFPNPVRGVDTTTFVARGVDAEALKVEIYDLSGQLVYAQEVPGNELVWGTVDLRGRYVANGVYLYRAWVKVNGAWVAVGLQRLVILR